MRVLTLILALCVNLVAQPKSTRMESVLSDADEVRIDKLLASKFIELEGMQSTPQTSKIEAYIQSVGDRLTPLAQRKLPYRFHFDPNPGFKSAFALPGGEIFVGEECWR